MATIDDLLSECDRLSAEATPGPWFQCSDGWTVRAESTAADAPPRIAYTYSNSGTVDKQIADAAFVAFARTAITTLAAALRAALPVVEAAKKQVESYDELDEHRTQPHPKNNAGVVSGYEPCETCARLYGEWTVATDATESAARAAKESDRG